MEVAFRSDSTGVFFVKWSVRPGSRSIPSRWCRFALRRSQSTTTVFSPEPARSRARLKIVVVLPSWGAVPVTSTTCPFSSRRAKMRAVRRLW